MSDQLVLRRPRRNSAFGILGSAVFVAVALWMIASPETFRRHSIEVTLLGGWFCLIVFGATCLLGLCSLLRPTELIFTPEGFQIHGLRLKPLVPWGKVERFSVSETRGVKLVAFTLKASAKSPARRAAGLIASVGYVDGTIPAYLGRGADEVAELLEAWRVRYGVGT